MTIESDFIILCGPYMDVTGVPIVIIAGQSQDNDNVTVETFILLPKRSVPLVTWNCNYSNTTLYVPGNESPVRHLSNGEVALAESWLRSYLCRELDPEQKILNPEIYSYKLEKLEHDLNTKIFLHEDYRYQLKMIKENTQCTDLSNFLKDLID